MSNLYSIGDFSRLTRLSVRMLRHYDQHGVLVPHRVDEFNGYRFYHRDQLAVAHRVRQLRDAGFGVRAIAELLTIADPAALRQALLVQQAEIASELDTVTQRLTNVEMLLHSLEEGSPMTTITRMTIPAVDVVTLRRVIPAYDREGDLWNDMMRDLPQKQFLDHSNYCGSIYHDQDFKENDVDVEIFAPITQKFDAPAPFEVRELPATDVLLVRHVGPYETLGAAFAAVSAEMARLELQLDGPMFQRCVVGPMTTDDPANYVTEICAPVK